MNIETELIESFRESLAAVPDAHLDEIPCQPGIGGRLRPDAILNAVMANREIAFVVKNRGDVFSRDAREIVWQLKNYPRKPDNSNRRSIPMVIARSVSEGARIMVAQKRWLNIPDPGNWCGNEETDGYSRL